MDHLTPDVLAAWMDGTLPDAERSAAEAHASDCAHCQAMLAAMARTSPPPVPRAWWSSPSVRWLVPAGVALVVFATWVLIDYRVPRSAEPVTVQQSAENASPPSPSEPQAPLADTKSQAQSKPDVAKTMRGKDVARREQAQAARSLDALEEKRTDAASANAAPVPSAPPVPPLPGQAPAQTPALPFAGVPQPPKSAANTPSAAPTSPPRAAEPAPAGLAETITVTGESSTRKAATLDAAAAAHMRPVDVISSEREFRWRAVAPGTVLYSMDSGASWQPSVTGTSFALHAGSAPSRTVCWLVGQAGTVLLTTDGQNWQVRPFPERVDLTGVSASDARNATVTTADHRRFATNDGGATWSPLQEN